MVVSARRICRQILILCCDNGAAMIWLGLGTKTTWLGFGRDISIGPFMKRGCFIEQVLTSPDLHISTSVLEQCLTEKHFSERWIRNLLWEETSTLTSLQFVRVEWWTLTDFTTELLLVRCGWLIDGSVLLWTVSGQSSLEDSRCLCVFPGSSDTFGL